MRYIAKLQAELAEVKSMVHDEFDGLSTFADTMESQIDNAEAMAIDCAEGLDQLEQRIDSVEGLSKENAMVMRSIVRRLDTMIGRLMVKVTTIERRLGDGK